MTIGPIPWTAVDRWARTHRVINRERFEYLIEQMDDAFLTALHEKDQQPNVEAPRG